MTEYKTCDLCKAKTNCNFDLLLFGDWQQSRDIVVHYFCLLLTTNLPQKGKDCSGINGFLLRDIRKEINAATKRKCCYCGRPHASIQCFKCKDYFHLCCGRQSRCLFTFQDDFRSYCDECIPKTDLQPAGLKSRPSSFERCSICREQMGLYSEVIFIFGKCCNRGYAHNMCVQKYALAAGYYLRCLWCRSKDFRESVRLQGVFVPDRDARWEVQKGTYTDLHRGHNTCNMDECLCPRGRDYNKGTWSMILCSLCGSVGAHNPKCLPGKKNAKNPVTVFKCNTCACTESKISGIREQSEVTEENNDDVIDRSIFMTKTISNLTEKGANSFLPSFSDDETQSSDSFVTVIPLNNLELNSTDGNCVANKLNNNGNFGVLSSHENSAIPVVIGAPPEVKGRKEIETQVIEIDCSDEESPNMVNEKPSPPPPIVIDVEGEEKQVFGNFCSNTSETKAAEETLLPLQSFTCNIEDETQVFGIPSKEAAIEVSPKTLTELERKAELSRTTSSQCSGPTEGIQNTSLPDESNQSPIVSSSSQVEENEEWITFEVYEYDEAKGKCIGSATVRINLCEERFAGVTFEQIEGNSCKWLSDGDVITRSDDIGIFAQIDAIIAEYT